MPVQEREPLQPLGALQGAKQGLVERAQLEGIDLIETFAKMGIAGDALNAVEGAQIRLRRLVTAVTVEL